MRRVVLTMAAIGAVTSLVASGCSKSPASPKQAEGLSLSVGRAPASVGGNTIRIGVSVRGIQIAPRSPGQFVVFVDREPVAVGQAIPLFEHGILTSRQNPIFVSGLTPGSHKLHIVLANGASRRIGLTVHSIVTVDVKGPSVWGELPSTIPAGQDVTVKLHAAGVVIVPANGDTSGKTGHYHVLVDTKAIFGAVIPPAVSDKIIHTAASSATIHGLSSGPHRIFIILGNGNHQAFVPPVMDSLRFLVIK
jgi:hypothetical protein